MTVYAAGELGGHGWPMLIAQDFETAVRLLSYMVISPGTLTKTLSWTCEALDAEHGIVEEYDMLWTVTVGEEKYYVRAYDVEGPSDTELPE